MRVRGPLIERDAELGSIQQTIEAAIAGEGGVLVVEGPAGIGKTSLLDEACRRAEAKGMAVVSAQGAALEHDFGFGAVRQLFEPVVARATVEDRHELLAGAAALAGPVVAPDAVAQPSQQPAVMHGLYWLTANLADRAPLLVVIDDVHWCDRPSLEFLVYLVRRLEGLPVGIVAAVRTGDPEAEASIVDELVIGSPVQVIEPAPLTVEGVREFVTDRMGEPDDPFVDACRTASGGVPFLLDELLRVLSADGVKPASEAAAHIAQVGPRTVATATILRLSRLSVAAVSVARSVAVLGRHARLDRVATLAGVDTESARAAVDALVEMEILSPGQPLQFSHGLVRQAIYDDLSSTACADAHGRAAALLTAEHAPVDEVAAHLLLSEPEGRAEVVDMLRAAAAQMLARAAPGSAVAYLRRALAEGAAQGQERAILVHELGSAEAFARDPRAVKDLDEALRLADDPVVRARIRWELAQAIVLSGEWAKAQSLLQDALAELGDRDNDLEAQIESLRAASEVYDPARAAEFDSRVAHLRTLVARGGPGTRMLALILAALAVCQGSDRAKARDLVEHGLDEGRLLRDEGSESLALVQGMCALIGLDDLDAAERATAGVFDDARERGSVMGYISGCFYRTLIDSERGRLHTAETFLRAMVERSIEHGVTFALPSAMWAGTNLLLERTGLDDIAALVESIELEPALLATIAGAWVLVARGRLRILHDAREEGIADLRAAGKIFQSARFDNPIPALWRSPLALALPTEEREEARALVEDELRSATRMGLARSQGVALRAQGLLEGGPRGIELFEESLRVLERADAPLERARTMIELGAAMRRANQRVTSREPLRAGLELAYLCGAERVAARAMEELHASGARPRREMASGPDALTSAEARVARMAADGLTNKEIAQSLFVTSKTVENQLSAAYRKLVVRSRDQLRLALSPESPD